MKDYLSFRKAVENKQTNPLKATQEFINNIKESKLNAFISINEENALSQAKESSARFANGNPRKLEGMVVAVKDNISMKGIKMTCGSKILENFEPIYNATVIEKLSKEGVVFVGKTNLDEFAMGSSNENSYFGNVRNNYDTNRVPGGSSGGSAVAVSAGLCHTALGSDTGGSIRQPAAFTGTYGIKPTYGRVSRFGLTAFASSLDQIGVFANTIEDTSLVLDTISGLDENDSTSSNIEITSTFEKLDTEISKLKIGILSDSHLKGIDDEILERYNQKIKALQSEGHETKEITFESSDYWIPTYYIVATAEASSNLSRYDGVRYGFRAESSDDEDFIIKTRSEGFGDEVKRRIMLGTFVLSSGYYDAYYNKALKVRRLITEEYKEIFKIVNFIFMPTTPTSAFKIGDKINDPISMYLSDLYTASANLAGIPAINIPAGFNRNGLPIGLQLQTPHFKEEELLLYSKYITNL